MDSYKSHLHAGFMTPKELEKLESLHSDFNKYWMPLAWFSNLAAEARQEGRVRNDVALKLLMEVSFSPFLLKKKNTHNTHAIYRK